MLLRKNLRRAWLYPLLSIAIAITITIAQPLASQAISWTDLLRGGIQIIQGVQLTRLSDSQEMELGSQINDELTSRQVRIVTNNPSLTNYINQVGQRLVPQSDRPNLRYTFQVVDDSSINAFATMGGFVYVHTGLIAAADNEAQLASVMAHEIGHIGGRHSLGQMRQAAIQRGLLAAGGLDRSTAVNLGVQLALNLPNSRRDEYDADTRGLRTLTRAGYAQSEMVTFMRKLLNSRSTPTFLSNHPATSDRINQLNKLISANPSRSTAGLDPTAYRSQIRALR